MLLPIGEFKTKASVVVIDYIQQSRKAAIVIEAAFVDGLHEMAVFPDENSVQVHGLIDFVRRPVRLEAVDPDLLWCVQVPTGFSPQWLYMAVVALGLAAEQLVSEFSGRGIEVSARLGRRRGNRELIELERRKLLGDQIIIRGDVRQVSQVVRRRNRKLRRIVQSRIKEP